MEEQEGTLVVPFLPLEETALAAVSSDRIVSKAFTIHFRDSMSIFSPLTSNFADTMRKEIMK